MDYETTDDIDLMIRINKLLIGSSFLLENLQNMNEEKSEEKKEKIKKIKSLVGDYLTEYCEHSIINDFIDIDLDRSKYIRYCEKCELTFQVKKFNN